MTTLRPNGCATSWGSRSPTARRRWRSWWSPASSSAASTRRDRPRPAGRRRPSSRGQEHRPRTSGSEAPRRPGSRTAGRALRDDARLVNTVVPTTTHHGPEEHPMDEADPVPLSLAAADPVDLWEMSIGELVDRVAADHPDRAALVFATPGEEPRRWTYRELVDDSVLVARALLRRFSPGDHVAVWAPNCAEW